MWGRPFDPGEKAAENAVLEAVATVVVKHLRSSARESAERDTEPVLIQVDGPGRTQFLNKLKHKLDPTASDPEHAASRMAHPPSEESADQPWTAITFDAWRYQRVAPPWWWLMSELDKQLRAQCWKLGWRAWSRQRWRDLTGRLLRLGRDLLWVVPGGAIFLAGWLLWDDAMLPVLKWLVTAGGGIAAGLALVSSMGNALRRHLLAQSPRGASALLRSTDPMAELLRRYAFLVRSGGGPIVVLIDNLDRCRAEYVVEMLEGIQTLLRHPPQPKRWRMLRPRSRHEAARRRRQSRRCPFIAFVVAADRGWLCDSYLHVYKEFEISAHEPGRPFGLMFLDKIFDVALRIPTVPPAAAQRERTLANGQSTGDPFAECTTELEVRRVLRQHELPEGKRRNGSDPQPDPVLRPQAVARLAQIELTSHGRQCFDTAQQLGELLAELDPGPAVQRQLDVAYCVQRTTQLLAAHDVDDDDDAIYRLGLWTILELRWPFLAEHLSRHPADLAHLADETTPNGIDDDLQLVFTHPLAHRIASGFHVELGARDITRFTAPIRQPAKTLREKPTSVGHAA